MSRLARLESLFSTRRHALDVATSQEADAAAKLKAAQESMAEWREALSLLQQAAETTQNLVHGKIAGVVTRCLKAVYGGEVTFDIAFDRKRGKTEARLFFRKGRYEVDPLEASSVGMVEVASFALRLAVLKLHTPPLSQVLVLDEPFRTLDREAKPRMAQLLVELAKETGTQIILVSHDPEFRVGKVVRVE